MASKIDIDAVELSMRAVGVADPEVQRVIADLKAQLEQLAAEKEKKPKVEKYKYIIARKDVPPGTAIDETPMVVVEATEEVKPTDVVEQIKIAANVANEDVKKLKKDPLKNIFDAVERIPAKYLKEKDIRVVSKTVTQVLLTDNTLDPS